MTSRRAATVKTVVSLTVAAATPDLWVTALMLFFASRNLGTILEPRLNNHQQNRVRR